MASKKNCNSRIMRLVDVEDIGPDDPRFVTDTELKEFILWWAKNYPDKPRRPEYLYMWLEGRNGISREEE